LVEGRIGSKEVIVLAGRAHLYEGYSAAQVTFGIRELRKRGVGAVILTNAAGGINLKYKPGDLVLISDHINLMGCNPVAGPNDEWLGRRFPDMSEVYAREHCDIARRAGSELGVTLEEGVYAALAGPSYETPAEIRYLRTIGADLVGMSTVPEAIAAAHMGMKVAGLSMLANLAAGISGKPISHSDVLVSSAEMNAEAGMLLERFFDTYES